MNKNYRSTVFLSGLALLLLCGFDFSGPRIPLDEIHSGGPPKDGIPALTNPAFVSPEAAEREFLGKTDRVLGLVVNGQAKAYPVKILNWHEIVNDTVGGKPVVVTFCPLCGTGMVFDGEIDRRKFTFGVSGLLYQSDLLMYDRQTESLWSQIMGQAVTGPMSGVKLKLLPSSQTTWPEWKKRNPGSLVLSVQTGHRRDYFRDPYENYEQNRDLMFHVRAQNPAYHPKEKVIGVEIAGSAKAYPFSELAKVKTPVKDEVQGTQITIYFDASSQTATIRDKDGKELPSVVGFWFAWTAFHPGTGIFKGKAP
ncbi:MAG: DUF3179 domain-containing protein [Nitrospinae bacterium]|nr:DUF3179 domain-containing protein [Nitrospinota bacterium]